MVNVLAVIATAVKAEWRREIIGFDIEPTESTAARTVFLRSSVARRPRRHQDSDRRRSRGRVRGGTCDSLGKARRRSGAHFDPAITKLLSGC